MLTQHQQQIIDEIANEFATINKRPKATDDKRFTLASVRKCEDEKEEFIQNINLHNSVMLGFIREKVLSDIKEFTQEFGSVIDVKLCRDYADIHLDNLGMLSQLRDDWMNKEHRHSTSTTKSKQIRAYFVSKTKNQGAYSQQYAFERLNIGDSMHFSIFITPKADMIYRVLEDGSRWGALRIIGTQYSRYDWLHDIHHPTYSSLDEMLQNCKEFQQQIVKIS
jgi:hypothetical protein